ncbi:hypothetical protein [Clostridium polynesiense]|uniref:hypothetical protein n=1 Tax=Clostridium polynesiense TaxID=1325933 RepID=UPI00058D8211|nr:hypothetical protein [Clostridium polynesiense]
MYICPVCGYDKLREEPYDNDGNPSYEICNCCGFEFGYDDSSEGRNFETYRKRWIEKGASWFNLKARPVEWDLEKQLININTNI